MLNANVTKQKLSLWRYRPLGGIECGGLLRSMNPARLTRARRKTLTTDTIANCFFDNDVNKVPNSIDGRC